MANGGPGRKVGNNQGEFRFDIQLETTLTAGQLIGGDLTLSTAVLEGGGSGAIGFVGIVDPLVNKTVISAHFFKNASGVTSGAAYVDTTTTDDLFSDSWLGTAQICEYHSITAGLAVGQNSDPRIQFEASAGTQNIVLNLETKETLDVGATTTVTAIVKLYKD